MTMRLDIVTNDAGDLVRREHARELGGGVVVAIYRLAKVAQMHDLGNAAFLRQLDQTYQMIGDYNLRSGGSLNVLFADKATFVAGQLLKGNRGAYEASAELGALLERIGGSELNVAREVTREDLLAFADQLAVFHRTNNASQLKLPKTITLRRVADAARLRGMELEDLTPDQRMVRAYASAVVIMRRFFEDLSASRYVLPRRIKRIAQSLVDLSDARATSFLGVTEARNANHDEAGRAVNTAILAVAIARESTQDRIALAQIAMAAMMHDVARPRALALAGAAGADDIAGPSTLSEDQEDRLAAGAAAVLTALGRVNEPSITRTVLTYEALWLRRKRWLGPVYWGTRPPTIHATIIAVARRYNDLLTPEPGLAPPTTDYAVAMLAEELTDPQERLVLRMLVSALALLPTGSVVQLATGEVAEVVRGSKGLGDKPRVLLLAGANGVSYAQPTEIELAQDPARTVVRILSVDGWKKGLAAGPPRHDDTPDELYDDEPAEPPSGPSDLLIALPDEPAVEVEHPASEEQPSNVSAERSGASLQSFGSTPSSVASAMGRILDDAAERASAVEDEPVDRTTVQQGPLEAAALAARAEAAREATARGNLGATPLPHVLVYLLDQALSGSVVFGGGSDSSDTIVFERGVPTKARLRATTLRLGEVLAEEKLLDPRLVDAAVEGARRMGILFGEYLVGHDLVSRDGLAWGLQVQLLERIASLSNLAPEIEYAYFRDVDLLDDTSGTAVLSHPLDAVLASVRMWQDRARVRATIQRMGAHPLTLHATSELTTLALSREEKLVLDALRAKAMPLAELHAQKLAGEEVVSSLVYTLAVTRQFVFQGQTKEPMASQTTMQKLGPHASEIRAPATRPVSAPKPKPMPPARTSMAIARQSAPQIRPIASRAPTGRNPPYSPAVRPASTSAKPPADASAPPRDKLPSLIDDEAPISIGRATGAGWKPTTVSTTMKGLGPLATEEERAAAKAEARRVSVSLSAVSCFRLAEAAFLRNDLAMAEEHARKAIERDPAHVDSISFLALIRGLGGAPAVAEESLRTLSKILIDDPANERALLYRGKLLVRNNRLHEALNDFTELLAANPNHAEAQAEAATVRSKLPV
jgi:hypothetical protein